ncbi:MAG: DUF2855 family protein [Pseudomonadota bacterium]
MGTQLESFQVRRDALTTARRIENAAPEPADGEIVLRLDRFAFTANNITYGVFGDAIGYWRFFPPTPADWESGWGVIPVWGFADVVASAHQAIPEGERIYGYWPPATHALMRPDRVSPSRFLDASPHRAELPGGYNWYTRVGAEPSYRRDGDDRRALLAPLHLTSFCIWDQLKAADWRGARRIVILSASSKTSIGLAFALARDPDAPEVVGLTSARSLDFVSGLGFYGSCLSYDALDDLDADIPTVVVDMSGAAPILGGLHRVLGENLIHCLNVGATHWRDGGDHPDVNQERSEFFFAPGHIARRIKEWGPEEFDRKSAGFLADSVAESARWLQVREVSGLAGLEQRYASVCAGEAPPEEGLIVAL